MRDASAMNTLSTLVVLACNQSSAGTWYLYLVYLYSVDDVPGHFFAACHGQPSPLYTCTLRIK